MLLIGMLLLGLLVFVILAVFLAGAFHHFREYLDSGGMSTEDLLLALFCTVFGLGILSVIFVVGGINSLGV